MNNYPTTVYLFTQPLSLVPCKSNGFLVVRCLGHFLKNMLYDHTT